MNSPEPVFESVSPNRNVFARVEQDANACYFYLNGENGGDFGIRSCWVRNLVRAPAQLDVSGMREGRPPMLPARYCAAPNGGKRLSADALDIVWAEEGDAAALRENGEILAIIPSWSGTNGFHGYARDCTQESPLCWPLGAPATNEQFARYARALDYWRAWDEGDGPWPQFQTSMCEEFERTFGKRSNYYLIDGGQWPPKALLRIPRSREVILSTLGMALRPQPTVELCFDDPALHRRVELGACLPPGLADESIKRVAAYLSGQSCYPWAHFTFLGSGHTMPSDVFAELSAGALPFVLLTHELPAISTPSLPRFRGDPVRLLWMTPISAREQEFAEVHGSLSLLERLSAKNSGWPRDFSRKEVA